MTHHGKTPFRAARALALVVATLGLAGHAAAKLPAPSDEAKAKAAEAAAKTAWSNQVANYQLCKSMDKVAAGYAAEVKKAGKAVTPTATPPCADPGPFVYTPAAPAAPAPAAPAASGAAKVAAAAPAAAPAAPVKK